MDTPAGATAAKQHGSNRQGAIGRMGSGGGGKIILGRRLGKCLAGIRCRTIGVAQQSRQVLTPYPPLSQDYLDKLEHIRGAVAHHVYEEEGNAANPAGC